MNQAAESFQLRLIPSGTTLHTRAIHMALAMDPPSDGERPAAPVANLLAGARAGTISIDLLIGAFQGEMLISAGVAVVSAGSTAMLLFPNEYRLPDAREAMVAILNDLRGYCARQSILLMEALIDPDCEAPASVLAEAGFSRLTELIYLRKGVRSTLLKRKEEQDLTWIQYMPDRESLFVEALEQSYVKSMDCPELTGLRPAGEVLKGHRATALFDPTMWYVVRQGGQPAGILLLNPLASGSAIEIEYVGVVPAARGKGVSDALMNHAVIIAQNKSAEFLALAVDSRNSPARRWYERWGFDRIGSKNAWIASLK